MTVLVAYASKNGATREIAERIAASLRASGLEAAERPVDAGVDTADYEAVVLGSAIYFESWLPTATEYVRHQKAALAERPVWLFSSGPLGDSPVDAEGRDLRQRALPKEDSELRSITGAREHHVFFGALDHTKFGQGECFIWMSPVGREMLKDGDYRDWAEIESWAHAIARKLLGDVEPVPELGNA